MTIIKAKPPADGKQTVLDALARRMRRTPMLSLHPKPQPAAPRGSRAAFRGPALGAPIPIYNIGFQETALAQPLDAARLVGWRYLVAGGQEYGIAHLSANGAHNEYAGLTEGYLPQRLIDAAQVADQALGSSTKRYQLRLLQIPALQIIALWLARSNDNRFVLMAGGGAARAHEAPPLVDDIRPVINAARDSLAPPRGAGQR
jgi:hypothetical protein